MWTRSFLISTLNQLEDQDAITNRLLRNPRDFGDTLSRYYEKEIIDEFVQLFTEHLTIASEYLNAIIDNDSSSIQSYRDEWFANADQLSAFFTKINLEWDENTWKQFFYNHLNMIEFMITHQLKQEYEESVQLYDMFEEEALIMADYMIKGIINEFYSIE